MGGRKGGREGDGTCRWGRGKLRGRWKDRRE